MTDDPIQAEPATADAGGDAVADLLQAPSIDIARRASAPLLQTTAAAKAAKDRRFETALDRWWTVAADFQDGQRLDALALLWRLTSLSAMSQQRRRLENFIGKGFDGPLPNLSSLSDPKDRKAVGDALLRAPRTDWVASYAARAVVEDPDPRSDARDAMCAVLLEQAKDISDAFRHLGDAIRDQRFDQQDAAAARARRLAWILRSLRTPLYENETALAERDFGPTFAAFVATALGSARTNDRSAIVDAARETATALGSIVRLHGLTLAAEAETYEVVDVLRRRFAPSDWPEDMAEAVRKLSWRIQEALAVLAKQGIADRGLRNTLILLLGQVVATATLKRLAERTEGIHPDIAFWLQTGSSRERIESAGAIEETATAMVDRELGEALQQAVLADQAHAHSLDATEPFRRMQQQLIAAARKRGLALRGHPGEQVDFLPNEHEADPSILGHRKVEIIVPLVEKTIGGRGAGVIIKARVKAIGEVHGKE